MGTHPEEIVSVYLAHTRGRGQCDDIGCVQLEFDCVLTRSDGHHIPVLVHASHIFSDSNSMLGIALFITDITSQKKALQLAAEVQKTLFPAHPPEIAGLDIAGTSIPCDEVGGDYYDYITGVGNSVAVAVGDISGHGVDSALLMSSARGYLKVCSSQYDSPERVVASLNRHLVSDMSDSGYFMSLFYLTIDIEKMTLDWVRAGHDPALLYDPGTGEFTELKGAGLALGVDPDFVYSVQNHTGLASGQIVMVMTDGIWEANNQVGEIYGKERLKDIVRRECKHSASHILQTVITEHNVFTEETVMHDDRTLILIKVFDKGAHLRVAGEELVGKTTT